MGTALAVCAWLAVAGLVAVALRLLREHTVETPSTGQGFTPITVVVAARNEASRIEALLVSLLAQDHPSFEVVVVDDRSEDGTVEAARRAAAGDPRVRVLRVSDRPEGWQGRLYAQALGVEAAQGEWLIFLSADQRLARSDFLRAMVADYERRPVAAVSVVGPFVGRRWWHRWWFHPMFNNPILWGFILLVQRVRARAVWLVGAPGMRRSTYRAVGGGAAAARCAGGGYDDWGWARVFAERGERTRMVYSPALEDETNWDDFTTFWQGMIRWGVGIFTYRKGGWVVAAAITVALAAIVAATLQVAFDLVSLELPGPPALALAAIAPTIGIGHCLWNRLPLRFAWFFCVLGFPVLAFLLACAAARARNRVLWRGEAMSVVSLPPPALDGIGTRELSLSPSESDP